MMDLRIKKTDPQAILPKYQTQGSVGLDLHACLTDRISGSLSIDPETGKQCFLIEPLSRVLIPAGFAVQLSIGFEAQIRPRSGLAFKKGLTVLNAPGTIDTDYRGEIRVMLINLSNTDRRVFHGDRIAQMIVAPVARVTIAEVEELSETARGEGGFGSTGV